MTLCFITFKLQNTFPSPPSWSYYYPARREDALFLALELGSSLLSTQTQAYHFSCIFRLLECLWKPALQSSTWTLRRSRPKGQYVRVTRFASIWICSIRSKLITSYMPFLKVSSSRTLWKGSLNQGKGSILIPKGFCVYYLVKNAFVYGGQLH